MKTIREAIETLNESPSDFISKKYKHVAPGHDGDEYAGDLVDEFTKLYKDLKKLVGTRPRGTEPEYEGVKNAIGNILGIR